MEIKRRKGESFEAMLRRFNKRVQAGGSIIEKRKRRHHIKADSKNKMKESKLRGLAIGMKREYLAKVGLLVEKKRKRGRRR